MAPSRKRKQTDSVCISSNRLKRVKRSGSNTDIFPKVCFSCGLNRKRKGGKTYHAYNITTENAAINIKIAAVKRNDKLRMIQFQPTDDEQYEDPQYLIRKELMTHKDCYLDYIKCLRDGTSTSKDDASLNIGNFSGAKQYIDENILNTTNFCSMKILHKIYGTGYGDQNARSYRAKLKLKLIKEYNNKLMFLTIDGQTPQVVISSKSLDEATVLKDKTAIIKQASQLISEEILQYTQNYELPWPLIVEKIKAQENIMPKLVKDHALTDSLKHLLSSFSSDVIAAVTRKKVITLKHFLLGVGLHNITGLKTPIKILSHLGHCIDYNFVCEIETAQAESAVKQLEAEVIEGETT